jgi:hypothetical protein
MCAVLHKGIHTYIDAYVHMCIKSTEQDLVDKVTFLDGNKPIIYMVAKYVQKEKRARVVPFEM